MKNHTLLMPSDGPPSMSLHIRHTGSVLDRLNGVAMFAFLVFVILAPLIVYSPALSGSTGEGNLLRQLVYLVVFAVALVTAQILSHPAALLKLPLTVFLVLVWCCISMSWAVNPSVGVRRLFLTVIVIWSIFLLVDRAGYEKTVASVRLVLPIVLMANYLAVLFVPSWAIHHISTEQDISIVGAWRGVLVQKNFAGVACALTILFFAFDVKKISWLLRFVVVAGAAIFLFYTNSRTSMGLLASSFVVTGLYQLYNPYYRWVFCILLMPVLLIAGVLIHDSWDLLSEPFTRQDALTGRVQIWPVLVRYWQDNWLLGSGFGSFWNVGEPSPISLYGRGWVVNDINSGHNGFLDLLVQIGLPGLVLAVLATFIAPLTKLVMHSSIKRSRASLLLACIWFCVCHNFTESSLFDRDATVHVFLMLAVALLGREARHQ